MQVAYEYKPAAPPISKPHGQLVGGGCNACFETLDANIQGEVIAHTAEGLYIVNQPGRCVARRGACAGVRAPREDPEPFRYAGLDDASAAGTG
jgi:hypothetical protein